VDKFSCRIAATAGYPTTTRVPGRVFWLQWEPNKQLPNVLLEGASPNLTRLFFIYGTALNLGVLAFTSLRDMSLQRSGCAAVASLRGPAVRSHESHP
jgi:hypothetical protein